MSDEIQRKRKKAKVRKSVTTQTLLATQQQLDDISDSFCAAKWYNSTIWLSNGRTASCHHPEAHYIPPREVFKDPSALHNTSFKKARRKEMQEGVRCTECSYCWRVEDIDKPKDVFSDRVYKSIIYTDEEINKIKDMDPDANINPKTLEISFDNLCNLSCTYCNQEFSSTWQNDIKSNGIYKNMLTDGGKTYQNDGDHAYSFGLKGGEGNLFIKAFFKWFDNGLKEDLQELRVTGGEPTRSPDFWKLVDRCEGADFDFAVNSNLILDNDRMKKLIDASHKFVNFDLYTSCETTEDLSKLVRHGFDYTTWNNNLRRFVDEANFRSVSIMMTISALTLYTITDFMDNMIDLKRERKNKAMFHMSLNILRFPSFQSVNILSPELKAERADHIESWLEFNRGFLTDSEASHILRLVQYLRNVDISYEDTDTQEDKLNDFVRFFRQYTKRRNLDLPSAVNHEMFTKWWEQINKEVGYVG
jgi:hypothetical protein